MAKHKQKMYTKKRHSERPAQPLVTTADILRSFSERLSELQEENAQVMRRAQHTDEMCSALHGDIGLALSRLEMETAERHRTESRLQLERDELARELAELKHRERRRARMNGEQVQHTAISPLTVGSTEEQLQRAPTQRSRRVSGDDDSIMDSEAIKTNYSGASTEGVTSECTSPLESFPSESSTTVDTAEQSPWTCPACTYENFSSAQTCDMCGTKASPPAEDSTPPIVSTLMGMGYIREDIMEAIGALNDAEKNEPTAIIIWIDAKLSRAKEEEKRRKQKIMEKARLHKEHEANERAARKKAEREAKEKARLEAEQAEERKAREAAERIRRDAREAKELARKVAEENTKREKERKESYDLDDKTLSSSVSSVFGGLSTMDETPGIPVGDESTSSAGATIQSSKTSSLTTKLVKAQLVSSRKASIEALPVAIDKLSDYLYPEPSDESHSNVSPIFAMLENKSMIESARTLLSLEDRCARLKKEADAILVEKESYERSMAALKAEEAELDGKMEVRLKRIRARVETARKEKGNLRTTKVTVEEEIKKLEDSKTKLLPEEKVTLKKHKQNLETILRAEREEESEPQRIKEVVDFIASERGRIRKALEGLTAKADKAGSNLKVKRKLVQKKRDEIVLIKKSGDEEDGRFDINGSRDEYGRTFLMIAVLNNDTKTAQLCFNLGASVDAKCSAGLTAMDLAQYFSLSEVIELIAQNGGTISREITWGIPEKVKLLHPVDWEMQLQIAERAAIPADTKLSSEEDPISDDTALLTHDERNKIFTCFDASLLDPDATNFRRVVLLEKDVCNWFSEADASSRKEFRCFVDRLQIPEVKSGKCLPVFCHRRFIVGIKREKQFEVLGAELSPSAESSGVPVGKDALVAFYSPFVESYINGIANVGVLIWAVTTESRSSRYIALIEAAEFLRHKVDDSEERFPAHRDGVLELGRDMHLLDLKSTSIFTGSAMELLNVNIDENDLERMDNENFIPTKRLLHHEQQLQQAIFRSSDKESNENQGILSMTRADLSTNLSGGAGTGKTLLMIRKVTSVDVAKRILVVSRLSRLVSFVKAAVDAERDTSNVAFFTYEDLLNHLSRRVEPPETSKRTFSTFNQVHFGETTGTGASSSINFEIDFVEKFLEGGERNAMKTNLLEPITLWGAFRVIKSHVKCSETKVPLSPDDYLQLPRSFGLNKEQRTLVYKLFLRYEEWLEYETFKWDEADRVFYILKYGPSVFAESSFVSWEERAFQRGEMELLEDGEMPLAPFFYHMVFADEAQDFSDLDMALFIRMSSSVRNMFLGADPAQSVELGIRMRVGTVNGVFHSCLPKNQKNIQVKNVLQDIQLKTNHRTHARNLEIGKAVRKVLTRSFGVPNSNENALMEGNMPEALMLKSMEDLSDSGKFRGGNVVFITPDENVTEVRSLFLELGVKNDVFGVREAKGLEFPSIALVGFFAYFQQLGNQPEWENSIRWLFSTKGITVTESSEKIQGKTLESCDYILSHPEIEDQAMMLYTALTRARGHLYFIEVEDGVKRKGKGGLAEFAFRQFQQLRLVKVVSTIDEGDVDMSPQQHKARGVLLVVQAINMSRTNAPTDAVKQKFADAQSHFQVDTGNDRHLLDQCNKHLQAILMKRDLAETIRTMFFNKEAGEYNLQGRFEDVLRFEQDAAKFFRLCANDSFLVEEIQETRALIEDVFYGTPYESHFGEICSKIKAFES